MKMQDLKELDLQAFIEELQNLDPQNIGSWPVAIKVFFAVVVFVVVLVGGYVSMITGIHDQRQRLESTENTLLEQYEDKAHRAQNLDQYKRQLADMEDAFGSLLQQLPRDTEVPGLLEDITHTGLGSGLDFSRIELGNESTREFYIELPIQIEVRGDYHGFGSFVSGVSALPRIVTLHDFSISRAGGGRGEAGEGLLQMSVTARTYRYSPRQSEPQPAGRQRRRR